VNILTDINETIKEVSPDFATAVIDEIRPRLYRIDSFNERWYYTLDLKETEPDKPEWVPTFYPSVTTMLNAMVPKNELLPWAVNKFQNMQEHNAYLNEAAAYGTCLHILFSMLLKGEPITLGNDIINYVYYCPSDEGIDSDVYRAWSKKLSADIWALEMWRREYKVEPIAIELPICHPVVGLAGTIDLVCTLNYNGQRVVAMVDLKSGCRDGVFYDSYKYQLAFYKFIIAYLIGDNSDRILELGADFMPTHVFNLSPKDWKSNARAFYNFAEQGVTEAEKYLVCSMMESYKLLKHEQYGTPLVPKISMRTWNGILTNDVDLKTLTEVIDAKEMVRRRHKDLYVTNELPQEVTP